MYDVERERAYGVRFAGVDFEELDMGIPGGGQVLLIRSYLESVHLLHPEQTKRYGRRRKRRDEEKEGLTESGYWMER